MSAGSTPSISAITTIGSGAANSATRSKEPRSANGSSNPSAMTRMRGRQASIERWGHQPPEALVVGVVQIQHGRLEGLQRYIAPHRASAWCVGRFAQILRKRPIHQHSLHILETG